ncbi:peroxisomal acyl-coenzyme A oxidase 3 isoform X1 [Bemisia tabaci]|uniref:peroxisomal acyl-coenzyme A oxidase 3 isoform X1 n=1 Tax=Bemisia tabaci TaxID=7038 RepID=UPI003B2803BB
MGGFDEVESYPVLPSKNVEGVCKVSFSSFEACDVGMVMDLPEGPLGEERKKATFDWKLMRLNVEEPSYLRVKLAIWSFLESDPLFHSQPTVLSSEEEKRITAKQLMRIRESKFFNDVNGVSYDKKLLYLMALNEAVNTLSPSLSVKFALGVSLFSICVQNLGTERHSSFIKDVWQNKILACVAVTEVAHGSDTKSLQTTATYDHNTKEFIINTPCFKAAKCWVGNLGKQCTHALLFAQLVVGKQCHGLHVFIVPIRDPYTMHPYPGIIVGDMGDKAGLNGIDNGFIMFRKYRIPKDYLLNRTGDITPSGEYESLFQNPQQILGAALETLSAGRIGIMQESVCSLSVATVIAIRYSGVRTQFSNDNKTETSLLDYQLQQWRLFPFLAAAYAQRAFVRKFVLIYADTVRFSMNANEDTIKTVSQMVSAVHAIVCCCKALLTWTCRDAVQECREACGGHGYHKAARLGDIRANHDPCVTYEGANHVLLQQTSRWLLRAVDEVPDLDFDSARFPASELEFLRNFESNLSLKFSANSVNEVLRVDFLIEAYQWLLCWLIKETKQRLASSLDDGENAFMAKNNVQVFYAQTLSLAFAENTVLNYFAASIQEADLSLRPVLAKLHILYGLTCIQKHLRVFYEGGYASGPSLSKLTSEAILEVCQLLRPDAVALADAFAPPDFILNSVLGFADGEVYKHLEEAYTQHGGIAERPVWWSEIAMKSKL